MAKPVKNYHLRIPSQTDNLELIRDFVSELAFKVGFDAQDVNKIELAVDEACTNVITHAYDNDETKDIEIAVKIEYDKFTVVVTDKGKGFKIQDIEMPNMKKYLAELRVGGLGIYLIKSLMDEVDYQTKPGGKHEVKMVKYFLEKDKKSRVS